MANDILMPSELPAREDPAASEVVPSDNGTSVASVTWADGVAAGRPLATQGEAEAGVQATKAMTPLTTKQAIDAQVPAKISIAIDALLLGTASQSAVEDFATAEQGTLADSAVQPGDLATVATTGDYDDLTNKPTLGTAAAADTVDFATAAQGSTADTALQPGDIGTTVQGHDAFLDALGAMTTGTEGQVIAFDASGDPVATDAGAGDMLKATYDPDSEEANAFAGPLNVKWRGAVGDGVTDDTAALAAAVAAAYAVGREVYWPEGTYLTTGNITNFRDVRHSGPGVVKRGSNSFYITPKAGQYNYVYCDLAGSADNDGLGTSQAVTTIQAAVNFAEAQSPRVGDHWWVAVAAGDTYARFASYRGVGVGQLVVAGPGTPGDVNTVTIVPSATDQAGALAEHNTLNLRCLHFDGTGFEPFYATSVDGGATKLNLAGVTGRRVRRGCTGNQGAEVGVDAHCHFIGDGDSGGVGFTQLFNGRRVFTSSSTAPTERAETFTSVANGTSYAVTAKRIGMKIDRSAGVGTLKLQSSPNNSTWTDVPSLDNGADLVSLPAGTTHVRMICSAYTSGTLKGGWFECTSPTFINFGWGLSSGEGSQGHLDNAVCAWNTVAGMSISRGAGQSNTKHMKLWGNPIGIVSYNAPIFNNSIFFGINGTVFENGTNRQIIGDNSERAYRELYPIRSLNVLNLFQTGTQAVGDGTSAFTLYESPDIQYWMASDDVNYMEGYVYAECSLASNCTVRVYLVGDANSAQGYGSQTLVSMSPTTIPAGVTWFKYEWDMQFRGEASQRGFALLHTSAATIPIWGGPSNGSLNLKNRVGRVRIAVIPANGDTVTPHRGVFKGTWG